MKRSFALRKILLLIVVSLTIVSADNVDKALRYRQVVPKGTGASASSATSGLATSNTLTSSEVPERTSTLASEPPGSSVSSSEIHDPTSDSESTSASASQEEPSTSISSNAPDDTSTSVPAAEFTIASDTTSASESPPTTTGPVSSTPTRAVSSRSQLVVSTVVVVNGGTSITNIITSTALFAVPGSAATSKGAPRLDGNADNPGSSGLNPSDRKVIIGTVVGIGGAIILGGIAVVVWRIWGKRKHSTDDDPDLMNSQPGSSGREKRSSVSDNSPFRSTLDQYHNPAGPVNAASNF